MAQVTMKGMLLNYQERKSKDGLKLYRTVRMDVDGKESTTMNLNIGDEQASVLVPLVQGVKYKPATATVELRCIQKTGTWLFDLTGVDFAHKA